MEEDVEVKEEEIVAEPGTEEEIAEGETNTAEEGIDQDEIQITIGEESQPQEHEKAPEWVRELRKSNREKDRRIRDLESKIQSTERKPVELGKRPTLEESDYDTDRYETALGEWYERKRQYDDMAARAKNAEMAHRDAWNSKLDRYSKAKSELKVRDYDDAEELVRGILTNDQQGYIVQCAKNAAHVVYALGKNPKKAQDLASIKDPLEFVYALSDIEKEIKVKSRKAVPLPEKTIRKLLPINSKSEQNNNVTT